MLDKQSVLPYISGMKYNLDKGCHAVYSLQFHYVACVKYRRRVLNGDVAERLKDINLRVAEKFGVTVLEQETDENHIHILFQSKPQVTLSRFVNSLKAVSARALFTEFPNLRTVLRGKHFWSPSYFLATTGQVSMDDLRRYVQGQGKDDDESV